MVHFIYSRCLKITENVSFNIASEASYVYILSGQKFIKNAKNSQFGDIFEKLKWSNSVTRKVILIRQKMLENANIQKIKCNIFSKSILRSIGVTR